MLTGKVALVTGAGRGIGRATVLALAREGCDVCVAARTESEIAATAAEVRTAGRRALAVPTDVSQPEQVARLFAATQAQLGDVDLLVNNAGAFRIAPIAETTLEEWDRILGVTLTGTFLCIKAALPAMMARRSGTILNIASTASKKHYVHQGAYCAAKHGVLGLSKVLGAEMREWGIRVCAICPGGVNTRLVQEQRDDIIPAEWMDPEDIAELCVFLAKLPPKAAIDEVVIRRWAAEPLA